MAVFSNRQVNQFYPVTAVSAVSDTPITATGTNGGTISAFGNVAAASYAANATEFSFIYVSPNADATGIAAGEGVLPSALISNKTKVSAVYKTAADVERKLQVVTLDVSQTQDGSTLTDGDIVAGQVYVINAVVQDLGVGGVYNQLIKLVSAYKAKIGDQLTDLAQGLYDSAINNLSGENAYFTPTLAGTVITFTEVLQPWKGLGLKAGKEVPFNIYTSAITTVNGDTTDWAQIISGNTGATVPNGRDLANYEFWAYGNRGENSIGWGERAFFQPNYLIDPTADYDVITISFDAEDGDKVGKGTITLAFPTALANNVKALIPNFVTKNW